MERQTPEKKAGLVGSFAAAKIARLQTSIFGKGPMTPVAARASLAKLRRLGTADGDGWMSVGNQFFEDWPEDELGRPLISNGQPTCGLQAIQSALRLYALHQQSQNQEMAMDGRRACADAYNGAFGWACWEFVHKKPTSFDGIRRRLAAIENVVGDYDGVLYQVRGLITFLRSGGIKLDYRVFASDLYLLQFEGMRDRVLPRWAKDFYLVHRSESELEEQ